MSYSNWMGDLLNAHPSFGTIHINNILMPGSHDSGTFNTGKATSDDHTARTQSLDMSHQLAQGVRYFDLRVMAKNADFQIYHGPWESGHRLAGKKDDPGTADKKYMLKQMRDFLMNHNQEILILKFQDFKHFGHDDYTDLVDSLERYFTFKGCGLVKLDHGTAAYINKETLNSLLAANKRVFVFFDVNNVPNEKRVWNHVFQYAPVLNKSKYGLWDPYWHEADADLADDNVDLNNKWWPWHAQNLDTWNSDGFFVLQSHMQQLSRKDKQCLF